MLGSRLPRIGKATAGRALGGEQIEGRRAVRELLAVGKRRTNDVWMADGLPPSPLLTEIADLARRANVPVRTVPRSRLEAEARSDAPQGVLAHAEPLEPAALDDLASSSAGAPAPFLVALDGVTDPHNLGAVLRTAEVAGATGAVLPSHGSAHVTPVVAKAAAGALEHIPVAVVPGLPSALRRLREREVWVVGLDPEADTRLFDLPFSTEAVALVVGGEGSGLRRLTRERCDLLVSIPRSGRIGSLNVAAAAALACFEVARRRGQR